MSTDGIPEITAETKMTASLFEAGLKCLTKCFLLSRDERRFDNAYDEAGIERWVTKYILHRYKCPICTTIFINPDHPWDQGKYGRNLLLLFAYLNLELHVPQRRVGRFLSEVLGFRFALNTAYLLKTKLVVLCKQTHKNLLRKIIGGRLIHADETKINLQRGRAGYIWAFTSMEDVAYLYTPSREGQPVQILLKDFKGVLVTDFYAAYESIDCSHQKCLLHLIRDLNDELMKEPFNEELKELVKAFAYLVRPMIETAGLPSKICHGKRNPKKLDFGKD